MSVVQGPTSSSRGTFGLCRTMVVEGVTLGVSTRRGQVVEVRHPDGSPPYLVQWVDNDKRTLVFPGPDARAVTAEEEARRLAAEIDATAR